jgi:cbb3-type cytochrome c oxidase subunit III
MYGVREGLGGGTGSWTRGSVPLVVCATLALLHPPAILAQGARPDGITDSSIARGAAVFHGPANCASCHGDGGQGTELGPALADDDWIRGNGTYEGIIAQVVHGVARKDSRTDTPMPIRGWTGLSDQDVRAVAAYVWSLSHGPRRDEPSNRR